MVWTPNRNSQLSLQQQITSWIKERIQRGEWPVHTKLPSQRKLAAMLGVNRSTIVQVIEELIADGVLETKVGAGTYVANNSWNILAAEKSPDWQQHIRNSIHEANFQTIQLINEYEQDRAIIRLGTGELAPELLPTLKLQASLASISFDARAIGYSEPKGNLDLRIALRDRLARRGIHCSPDCILIVSGALQALQLISIGLLAAGSYVIQETPSYLNSVHPFQSAGMRMILLGLELTELRQIQHLHGKRQAICYTVPTLHNPTGSMMSLEARTRILQACTDMQIPIIEDDAYGELTFDEAPPSLKSLDHAGQVLYLGTVSKTLSPGLRIGWVVGPESVIDRLADIKMQTDYGSSAFSQAIVLHWLVSGQYDQHVTELRLQLRQRAAHIEQVLRSLRFANIAAWETSLGGFYIWLRFHEPVVNKALFLKLLKHHVLINPGYIYDPGDAHHIRLSYAFASAEQLELGLSVLYQAVTGEI